MLKKVLLTNKKGSQMKRSGALFVGGILVLLAVTLLNPASRQAVECMYYRTPVTNTLKVNEKSISTELVSADTSRIKGLSDRPCIKENQAMLFVFDKGDQSVHCFWMKDMRFAIDIVWLDSSKRVVDIARNVQPETYPTNFCPSRATAYVLEVKANTAQKLGLDIGTIVKF